MKRKIATLGETDITVHPAAGILLLLGLLTRWRALLICTYASIILHETAHAAVSALWHHPPQEVEITPLGAMMRLEDEERLPLTARISVILAGPLMTLILCALSLWLTQNGVIPRETGRLIFLGNAGILLVNLLPALPLDGGRLLSAVLLRLLRRETCWRVMRIIGTAAAKFRAGRKKPIAVMSGRNAHTPAVFLGAVYAGCCYAPMDGTMPVHRLNSILNTLDTDLMIEDLKALKRGETIHCPVYDYAIHNRTDETVEIKPTKVVIVEGILIFQNKALRDLLDIKIFVETDADVRILRRALRDVEERGRSLESVVNQYLTTVKPMHEQFVEPTRKFADIIVLEGGHNLVALDMIMQRIAGHIKEN